MRRGERERGFFWLPFVRERNGTLQEIKAQDQQFTELATDLKHWSSAMVLAQLFIAGKVCGGYFLN